MFGIYRAQMNTSGGFVLNTVTDFRVL